MDGERRGHIWKECDCGEGPCMWCGGGLSYCIICGGFEGSLTTECCGRPITDEEEHKIYQEASLDFKGGEWMQAPNYPRCSPISAGPDEC